MATPAKTCKQALADATARWPKRNRASDGIMGDVAHQKRKSDHNDGNAFDLTHDPVHGPDCDILSRQVINDPRVTYVIWEGQIFKRREPQKGWQKYTGTNAHNHHMHVSITREARDSVAPWPWTIPKGVEVEKPIETRTTIPEPVTEPPAIAPGSVAPLTPTEEAKGITTGTVPPDKPTEGTPPPAKAVEIEASKPSLLSKVTSLSIPTGVTGAIGVIWKFAQAVPPWGWAILGGVFIVALIVAAWLWNEAMNRAQGRTLKVLDAAADKNANNLRLV